MNAGGIAVVVIAGVVLAAAMSWAAIAVAVRASRRRNLEAARDPGDRPTPRPRRMD